MQVTKYFLIVSMGKFKVPSRCTFIYFELDDDETMRQIVSTVIPFVKYIYISFLLSFSFFLSRNGTMQEPLSRQRDSSDWRKRNYLFACLSA